MSAIAYLLQIIAIAADDPKAASLNDVEDVERCAAAATWWPVLFPLQRCQWTLVQGRIHSTRHHRIASSACSTGSSCRSREMPGELEKIRVWFRDYKVPTCLRPSHTASRAMSLLECMLRRACPFTQI